MPGPVSKPKAERRNRTQRVGARVLHAVAAGDVVAPSLPDRVWHPLVLSWWADIWLSPMAPEWQASDVHGLFELAGVMDRFWRAVDDPDATPGSITGLAMQLRQGRQQYGLSPLDRRRLEWEIDRGDGATDRTAKRKALAKPKAVRDPRVDGRNIGSSSGSGTSA